MIDQEKIVSPSRTYVAMCNKTNSGGHCFHKFVLSARMTNNADSAYWYFVNWVSIFSHVESIIAFEDYQNLKECDQLDVRIYNLIQDLKNENWDVRRNAAHALSNIGPRAKEAIPALIVVLKDKEEVVRNRAARALGMIGLEVTTVVPALIRTLKDEDWHVRMIVVEALGRIGKAAKDAIPALTETLKDEDRFVRETAKSTLAIIRTT